MYVSVHVFSLLLVGGVSLCSFSTNTCSGIVRSSLDEFAYTLKDILKSHVALELDPV